MLSGPWAFVGHVNNYCAVFGRRGLATAMRRQVEPSRSDGLFAAGALWVGDHCSLLPRHHYLGLHPPRLARVAEPLLTASSAAALETGL